MNIQKMMKQAQEMQQKISDMQAGLERREIEGAAGGGMVRATLNGKGGAVRVVIDPSLMQANEKDVLEDLLVAAFNDAKTKIDAMFSDEMSKLAGGMNLPPGMKLPF